MTTPTIIGLYRGDYVKNNPKGGAVDFNKNIDCIAIGFDGAVPVIITEPYNSPHDEWKIKNESAKLSLYVRTSLNEKTGEATWKKIGLNDVDFDGDGKADKTELSWGVDQIATGDYRGYLLQDAFYLDATASGTPSTKTDVNGDGINDATYGSSYSISMSLKAKSLQVKEEAF